jgi:hypothetical protein
MKIEKIGLWIVSFSIMALGWILYYVILKIGNKDFNFDLYALFAGLVIGVFFKAMTDFNDKHLRNKK